MKRTIIILFFIVFGSLAFAQTSFISHRVQKGETVYSITKQYNIPEAELFRLNPEVRNGLKEDIVLIIPKTQELSQENAITFKTHKVKRKETLFGIASNYGTHVEEIKKYNKHLYANNLKRGEEIQIPIRKVTIVPSTPATKTGPEPLKGDYNVHKVQARETKFGISQQYGITVAELEAMNPSIYGTDNLPLGFELKVPEKAASEKITPEEGIDAEYTYYTIQPKEGFYRLKVLFGLDEAAIIALNPHVKEGLKEGMLIKVPKTTRPTEMEITLPKPVSIEYTITDFKTKNIVLFLPFQLDKIQRDSIAFNENLLATNSTMRIALDFYSGVLLAAEFAKKKGISLNLYVFDTREMESGVNPLFKRKNIDEVDLVIGPLRQAHVERVSSELAGKNIPVLSPLSNRQGKMTPNFIHSIPSTDFLEMRMISYLKQNSPGKKLILITDATKLASKQKLQNEFPGITIINPREGGFFRNQDIAEKLSKEQENWVILESSNTIMVSSAVGALNSLNRRDNIRLFTLDNNDAFEFREVSNLHLANLQFTFPSRSKTFNVNHENEFVKAYKAQYGIIPNRFAVRGFDVTYDALLRLAYSGNIFETNDLLDGETSYLENKFHYVKKTDGGYYNTSVYLLKYTKDLDLEEAE